MYKLTGDPWELKNLAKDPAYADTLQRLRAELAAWMKGQGDEGLATERMLAE